MNEQAAPNAEIASTLKDRCVVRELFEIITRTESLRAAGDLTHIRISYINAFLRRGEPIRDALSRDEKLGFLQFEGQNAIMLLLDPEPDANWAHLCWLATYDVENQQARVVVHNFPPEERLDRRLVTFIASHDLTAAA